jgi:tripartite-type tricarboxylate transporter receptor subunit TctC
MAKVKILAVPYKGTAPAVLSVLSGEAHLTYSSIPTILPHVRGGKVRALGVGNAQRLSSLPEFPTIAEAGVPDYVAATWTGVIAPAGVPRPIVDKLNAAINKVLASEAFKEKFAKIGDEPGGGTPEEFAATIRTDSAKWADVIKRSGARLE